MEKNTTHRQGDVLLLLVHRSGMQKKEVAEKLEIHPNHLSRVFDSEKLTKKVRLKAAKLFNVPESAFDNQEFTAALKDIPGMLKEADVPYKPVDLSGLTAAEVFKLLEENDRRHYEERGRLLAIIENLTKK